MLTHYYYDCVMHMPTGPSQSICTIYSLLGTLYTIYSLLGTIYTIYSLLGTIYTIYSLLGTIYTIYSLLGTICTNIFNIKHPACFVFF